MNTSEIILVPVMFLTFYLIIKNFLDYRLKRSLVEKGLVKESHFLLSASPELHPLSSVKWGLVLVGVGAAILLAQLFPEQISDEIMVGLMLVFAGVSFLIYYRMAKGRADASAPRNIEAFGESI